MKTSKILFLTLLSATLIFSACDDDEPTINEGTVNMMFEYKVGEDAFETGKVYEINGTAVQFDLVNFYVGGIEFKPEHGDDTAPVSVDGKYLLVTPDAGAQEVATIPTGHWHTAKFYIGVGAEENGQSEADFTSRDADDPLSVQTPPMHWNWNSGYRFVRIDGSVDTDGDGTPETTMEIHLGTDAYLTEVSYDIHKDIEAGSNMVHFEFDVAKALGGIDLSQEHETHTFDNEELATKVKENLADAISPAHQ